MSPGAPGSVSGSYAGRLVVEDERFDALLELRNAGGGRVAGTFRVGPPLAIEARVTGVLIDELLRLTVTYEGQTPETVPPCAGRIEGILSVDATGGVIDGPVTIVDCEGSLPGRMSFRR